MVTGAFSERICETLFSFYYCTFWKITHYFDVAQVVGVSGQFVEGSKKVFWLIKFFFVCPLGLSLLVGRKKNGGRAEIFCFMVIYCPDMVEREKRERVGGGGVVRIMLMHL